MALAEVKEAKIPDEVLYAIGEFISCDLTWLANFLHKKYHRKYGLTFKQINKLIQEKLPVSV